MASDNVNETRRFVALIPARGGSKGIPRKNLRDLAGKPLIAHTIDAAWASLRIDEIFLSSDDEEILAVGAQKGCRLIKRPAELASDDATAVQVVEHFLSEVSRETTDDLAIVYLQPTSPLRTAAHIDEAIGAMLGAKRHSLVSVVELEKSPFKSFVIDENGGLKSLFDEKLSNLGRQQLPTAYVPNGALYVFPRSEFMQRKGFPSNGSFPYVMSVADSVDIDVERDFETAHRILEHRYG